MKPNIKTTTRPALSGEEQLIQKETTDTAEIRSTKFQFAGEVVTSIKGRLSVSCLGET